MKQQIIQQFDLFWNERDARERKLLSAAAFVIVLALVYMIFLDPAITSTGKLQSQIPELRQQVAEISALSGQQIKLAASLTQIVEPVTKEIVEASLTARGIKTQSLSVTDDIVRIQIQTVAYSNPQFNKGLKYSAIQIMFPVTDHWAIGLLLTISIPDII